MKNSTIINIFLALFVGGFVFGVLLPWMISAKDTVAVVTGLFVLLVIGLVSALYINKLFKNKDTQEKVK